MDHSRTRLTVAALACVALVAGIIIGTPNPVGAIAPPPSVIAMWGSDASGRLGNGAPNSLSDVPVRAGATGVLDGTVPSTITNGASHACTIASGKPYCWGANNFGQLGNDSKTDSNVPVAVDTSGVLSNKVVTAIAAGGQHTCVIAGGQPYCWGRNYAGALGDESTDDAQVPVAVKVDGVLSGKTVSAIAAGGLHTCAIADGKPYCWGYDNHGQLGNDVSTLDPVTSPVAVKADGALSGKTATTITAGDAHTCVVASGTVYCWGNNAEGQLGDTTQDPRKAPVAVDPSGTLTGKTISALASGFDHNCVIADGGPFCWGSNLGGQLGFDPGSAERLTTPLYADVTGQLDEKTLTNLTAGTYHTCVLASGTPYCWGTNEDGQLGDDGSPTASIVPVPVVDTNAVLTDRITVELDAGGDSTGALAMIDPDFCDVTPSGAFFTDIVWLNGVGIATGFGDGCFKPASSVTRQAMAAFLYRALNPGVPLSPCGSSPRMFVDVPKTNGFCPEIEWLASSGITTGFSDKTFRPTNTVTRQAMAAFLFRALNPGKPDPTCTGSTRTFSDVASSNPFCGSIEWLALTGITSGFPNGTYQPTGTVSRQAMAAFLHRALT